MRDLLFLITGWLPFPLDIIVLGVLCLMLIWAVVKLISAVWDMLPFT